jgi:hypothetical protein
VTDAAARLRALAVPRLTGSAGNAAAREYLKRELTGHGMIVDEQRFAASDAPLRRATAAAELAAFAALFFAIGVLAADPWRGLRLAAVPLALLALLPLIGRARGRAPLWGVNLVGRRAAAVPRTWLAAHYDSKGQRISMATRLLGFAALALQVPAAVALAGFVASGARGPWLGLLVLPALCGGAVLSRAGLRNDSPGAVDNASGVLAALEALDRLPATASVGVLFLDAEELGLQGARALARAQPELLRGATIVNFDGIDDRGTTLALTHRSGPLADQLARATGAVRVRWLPVLVDGIALAPTSRECVTVMRGSWGTMTRVHTTRDVAEDVALDGVRHVASVVAEAMRTL